MKNIIFAFLATALFACGGDSKDPDTNDLGEFNPPSQLASLTRDEALELTWVSANAEDDFQGYHVFGSTKSIAELQELVEYPEDASLTASQSIPRCKDNSAFFEAFGFPESDADCESSVLDEDDGFFATNGNMGFIVEEDDEKEEEEEDLTIDFNIPCTGDGQTVEDGSISLAAAEEGKTLGRSYCLVNEVYNDGKLVDIENGTTYTYMVVAVKGSDKNEISWISNVIADTPAHQLFHGQVTLAGGDSDAAKYVRFAIDAEDFSETDKPTATDCTTPICTIGSTNSESTDGIYIGRDSSTGATFDYAQRLFISTPSSSDLSLQFRGAQVWENPNFDEEDEDSDEDEYLPQVPGDEASSGTYLTKGKKYAFYERAVFDFKYDLGDSTYRYGKIAITNLSYDDDEDKTSDVTLDITIVIQPDIDNAHYLQ